jgi:hypothetical protein
VNEKHKATDAAPHNNAPALPQRSVPEHVHGITDAIRRQNQYLSVDWTPEKLFERWWSLTDEGDTATLDAEFKTPKELSDLTRHTESRIRGCCMEGKIPNIKIMGRIYIHMPTLRKVWLRLQT